MTKHGELIHGPWRTQVLGPEDIAANRAEFDYRRTSAALSSSLTRRLKKRPASLSSLTEGLTRFAFAGVFAGLLEHLRYREAKLCAGGIKLDPEAAVHDPTNHRIRAD